MSNGRIFIAIAIILISYPLKCVIIGVSRKCNLKVIGINVAPFRYSKQFRLLGWDFASASWGLFVASLVQKNSQFSMIYNTVGELQHFATITYFTIFILLYSLAILTRFGFMETAENGRLPRHRRRRWLLAGFSWFFGLLLVLITSSMAISGGVTSG